MAANEKTFSKIGIQPVRVTGMESHEIPSLSNSYCPSCGAGPLEGVTGAALGTEDREIEKGVFPHDGSPGICAYCGELHAFRGEGKNLSIELPTPEDIKGWKDEPTLWQTLSLLQESMKEKAIEGRLRGDMRYAKSRPRRF